MPPLTRRQLNFLSAGARHVADAERLLNEEPTSPDQAWHLAGFGPECARKACIEDAILDKALGHDLGPNAEMLLEWWIPLDPNAWRYRLSGWAAQHPRLAAWMPDHRYERTGTRQDNVARELTAAARRCVDTIAADLWCDGRLRDGAI